MSITNELREWMRVVLTSDDSAWAIADRIDAKHEKALAKQHYSLTKGMTPMTDKSMAEQGWMRLPKDADGVPIHVNDVMDTEHFGTVRVEGFVHRSVAFYNYSEQPACLCTTPAELCRHHHEPTVKDVLREFAECWDDPAHYAKGELVETFAEKLRLADGGDEQ